MKTFLLITLVLLSGCASMGDKLGTTSMVKQTKDGGRILLNGTGTWMEEGSRKKAEQDMDRKCPNGYEITEEGLTDKINNYTRGARAEKYLEFKCKS